MRLLPRLLPMFLCMVCLAACGEKQPVTVIFTSDVKGMIRPAG